LSRKIMVATFLLAQLADILTTNAALARGAWEGNPMMAAAQAALGVSWFVPKLALVALLLWMLCRTKRPGVVVFAAALSVVGPVNNVVTLVWGI